MKLWHFEEVRELVGPHRNLSGMPDKITGDISGLTGCLDGLTGRCEGLAGNVSSLVGNISGITGTVDPHLRGNVSGLQGDVTGIWGNASGLKGQVQELADVGMLWPGDEPLRLGMFATRYNLPMEFFDNSGSPALIAYHALEGAPLHWVTVCGNGDASYVVGPLAEIAKRSFGQEIMKVAVPDEAHWEISEDLLVLHTDKLFAFEHVQNLVSNSAV